MEMKSDLVEKVKFCFTSKVISQLSMLVDETEPGVERALSKSVPLVLNGMLSQVERGVAPAALLNMVREADAAEVLTQLSEARADWHERGTNLLLDLLSDTYRSTVNQIAVDASIRPTASGTLLQVAATAVLGVLGKFAAENDLTPSEFILWLQSQKDAISAAMLPAFGSSALVTQPSQAAALRQPAAVPPRMTAPVRMAREEPAYAPAAGPQGIGKLLSWQWGVVLLLLAVGLGYFFGSDYFGRANRPLERTATTATPDAEVIASEPADPITTAPPAANETPPVATAAAPAPAPAATATTAPVAVARPAASRPAPTPRPEPAGGRYDINRDTYIYDTGRPILLTLADGSHQKVGANSSENRLYTFLATAAVQVDSVNRTKGWINFDRVYFEPGSATLTSESMPQLRNIASILKTFPKSVVKIGGYTDSTGVALSNLELSEARARAAMLALANMGIDLDRLQAKGYGAKYFVSPNTTPATRSLNRRVSIRVLKK
ncbi:OmpA family protein [Hymenobacter terricola]|uniref:OmpA family protein n=1 Tax=Hymenobacter terricola TaxID=2819236 RepID=UPI001B3075C0|nr:OmpA family protein [Hymenobacter terricola]